jgi:hypothetical protein
MSSFIVAIMVAAFFVFSAVRLLSSWPRHYAHLIAEKKIAPAYGNELTCKSKNEAYFLLGLAAGSFLFISKIGLFPSLLDPIIALICVISVGVLCLFFAYFDKPAELARLAKAKKISAAYAVESVKKSKHRAWAVSGLSLLAYVIWLFLGFLDQFGKTTFTVW